MSEGEQKPEGERATLMNVLVVDDRPEVGMVVGTMVQFFKANGKVGDVVVVNSPIGAMERFRDGGYNVLFTDKDMPEGNEGLMLAKQVRQEFPASVIILMTGDQIPDEAELKESGIDLAIGKPPKLQDLGHLLDNAAVKLQERNRQ